MYIFFLQLQSTEHTLESALCLTGVSCLMVHQNQKCKWFLSRPAFSPKMGTAA